MADLVVTEVRVVSNQGNIFNYDAADPVDYGYVVYRNIDQDGGLSPASADERTSAEAFGIALLPAKEGEQVVYVIGNCDLQLGTVLEKGQTYVLSHNPGKIKPITDLQPEDFVTYVGYAVSEYVLRVLLHPTGVNAEESNLFGVLDFSQPNDSMHLFLF